MDFMPIHGKEQFKITRSKKALRLNIGIYQVHEIYQICYNDHLRLTFDLFIFDDRLLQ